MRGQAIQCGAALCAASGAWLLVRTGQRAARVRRLLAGQGRPRPGRGPGWRSRPPWRARAWRLDAAGLRLLLGWLALGGLLACWAASPVPLVASCGTVPLVARWWRRRRAARAARLQRDAVVDFCVSLAGEVGAGRPVGAALTLACRTELGPAAAAPLAAASYGGDVPAALRSVAERPGAEGLRGIAACWEVAVQGGASLAAGLERVAEALRAERDQHEELRAQLAGPRATATALALLPVLGLALGATMGVSPLGVLLGTPAGGLCLALGVLFQIAGMAWVAAIVRAAERASP
ncbi:type II secretion system F family protein [Streptomyces sp. DSM 44915]|uniref:Type II secretion system F family protein n=1 Tax=Streptomyces chisholmiae TaxID=3075540 RepID=A0ABU2JPJ9_9ACTN|nr:type II secretion system F family protein [Streptomyces sp. DSM 44915]MDT0266920.1 type II secretion system F family protein [Streptomyces sp. DSM 44915]